MNFCHFLWEATLFQERSMLKLTKKRNIPDSAVLPWNINKISSLTCFIPCLYHDWENMEITSNFVAAVLLIWFNCLKTAEPLGGNSLFFTTGDPGTHSLVVEVLDF